MNVKKCRYPWKRIHIGEDDQIRPECYCRMSAGDLKGNEFDKIWNGEIMKKYRSAVKKGNTELCDHECRYIGFFGEWDK